MRRSISSCPGEIDAEVGRMQKRFHDLRHTFISIESRMAKEDEHIEAVLNEVFPESERSSERERSWESARSAPSSGAEVPLLVQVESGVSALGLSALGASIAGALPGSTWMRSTTREASTTFTELRPLQFRLTHAAAVGAVSILTSPAVDVGSLSAATGASMLGEAAHEEAVSSSHVE